MDDLGFARPNRPPDGWDTPVGAGSGAGRPATAPVERWRFVVLARIDNYPVLRRYLGRARVERLGLHVAQRIASLLPGCRVSAATRDIVEIAFEDDHRRALDRAIERIEAAFVTPCDVDGECCTIDLVLAAAVAPCADADDVRLIEEAEGALAEAQLQGRVVVRDMADGAARIDRVALARDLTTAIGDDQLFLHYQPKVHLRRQEVSGLEALIRWRHPTRGLILPSDFIPIAEESRDILSLTLWTLEKVIADQRIMAEQGHHLPIFINIAGGLLADTGFVRRACALVQGDGCAKGAGIGFEITETSVIRDPESAIANLKIFADIGITVAIDDYGAGLSSLAYLKQLPARELKIDKLFVTQLTSSNRDPLIVRSTIDLAHALDMEVVAEGVETSATLALLSVMGCDQVQGFLISRPLPIDALLLFLADDRLLAASMAPQRPLAQLRNVRTLG